MQLTKLITGRKPNLRWSQRRRELIKLGKNVINAAEHGVRFSKLINARKAILLGPQQRRQISKLAKLSQALFMRSQRIVSKRARRLLPAPKGALWGSLGGVAGGLLALGAGGVLLASRIGRNVPLLSQSLLSPPKSFTFRGQRVVYYQQGDGPPIVLLHGIYAAASAFEMREPFSRLSHGHRVFAPDLLGFGASSRPVIDYKAEVYIDLIISFLRDVVGQPATLIASSLTAAYAAAVAAREPRLVKSLVLVNPTGIKTLAAPQSAAGRLVERLFRSPMWGQGLFNLLVSRPSLRYYLDKAYGDAADVSNELVEHSYQTAHQPGANLAPAAFVGRGLNLDLRAIVPQLDTPTMVLWSGPTEYQNTVSERAAFEKLNPKLSMRSVESSGAMPYDDDPAAFAKLISDFLHDSEHRAPATTRTPPRAAAGEIHAQPRPPVPPARAASEPAPASEGQGRPAIDVQAPADIDAPRPAGPNNITH